MAYRAAVADREPDAVVAGRWIGTFAGDVGDATDSQTQPGDDAEVAGGENRRARARLHVAGVARDRRPVRIVSGASGVEVRRSTRVEREREKFAEREAKSFARVPGRHGDCAVGGVDGRRGTADPKLRADFKCAARI